MPPHHKNRDPLTPSFPRNPTDSQHPQDLMQEEEEDDEDDDGSDGEGAGGRGAEPARRKPIYNVDAIHDKLEDIAWTEEQAWEETQAVTGEEPTQVDNVEDDLGRELAFYNQVRTGGDGGGSGGVVAA